MVRSITEEAVPVPDNSRVQARSEDTSRPANEKRERKNGDDPFVNRKPISEVLHDIYDGNVQ